MGGPCHLFGSLEILAATPVLLHLMDLCAQEVSAGGHLLKSGRGHMTPTSQIWAGELYNKLIWLPSWPPILQRRLHCRVPLWSLLPAFPLFCLWWGHSLGVSSISTVSSSSCLKVRTPWSKEWCQCFVPACGTHISNTLGMGAAGAGPLSATACSWAAPNIPRRVASGTLLVRNCTGYRSFPRPWVGRLVWLPQRPPWRLGDHTLSLPLSGTPALTHYLREPVGGHRLWLHGTPQLVLWCHWPGPHSGEPPVPHLSPALCSWDPLWPCLWVVTLGPHSFSPVMEVAYLTVQLVWP